ncbi:MAG: Aspartyl/glutamyl-tRNA(Asn/Gln) amidotransferase subunit C [Parcubacteria group bacterium GW2011_GWF2_43_11]|nr:MAG: Aspartyl/glutamyl-tRNA(Asn/Gln) amidotransferase subunit C [Parcubacteria group bacterium GW2011_GWF2_43_11]
MISLKEVRHIAALARLNITKKEEEKFRKDLSATLDYIEKLKKVDVAETKETSHPLFIKNIFRKDEAERGAQNLLELAPETEDNYIKVKSILK